MNVKSNLMLAAVAAALIPIVIFASGATIYLNNLPEFTFTLPQCFVFLSLFSLVTFLFLFFPLYFLRKCKCFNIIALSVFGIGLCMWVQGFFMIYPFDIKNSVTSSLQIICIGAWEIFIYIIIFILIFYFRNFILQNSLKLLIIVSVTQFITVFPALQSYNVNLLERIPQYKFQMTNSQEENIIFIVVDSTGTDIFEDLLKSKSDYKEYLRDFEYFNHLLSLYPCTIFAIPTLFSGSDYFDNTIKLEKYATFTSKTISSYLQDIHKMYQSENTLLPKLQELGYHLEFYPYAGIQRYFPKEYTFENLSYDNDDVIKKKIINTQVVFQGYFTSILTRVTPLIVSDVVYNYMGPCFYNIVSIIKGNYVPITTDNLVIHNKDKGFFENMTSVSCDNQKRFRLIHLWGTHVSDAYPKDTIIPYETLLFDGLTNYLKYLQTINCYDNSWIIIMGDHGQHKGVHKYRFNPIFLVKRPHAHHETLQVNNDIILMRDIAPTLLGELGIQTEKPFSIWNQTDEQKKERQKLWNEYFVKNAQ